MFNGMGQNGAIKISTVDITGDPALYFKMVVENTRAGPESIQTPIPPTFLSIEIEMNCH